MKLAKTLKSIALFKVHNIYITFLMLLILMVLTYFTYYWQSPPTVIPELKLPHKSFTGLRLVHLDLKGAPPKIPYYTHLFPLLSSMGATGLLIEYEDMFPYSGILRNITATNAYSLQDIQEINRLAERHSLTIIPLVQTFGHMEFILKLAEFKELREVGEYPQVVCPTHNSTITIVMEMIGQVMNAHPWSNILHIGSDEVFNIGLCDRCTKFMSRNRWSKSNLFLSHVKTVARLTKAKFPSIRLLTWDDEFRNFETKEMLESRIADYIEPVVWKYSSEVCMELNVALWNKYSKVFPRIWIASAFKGATGSNQYHTNVMYHLDNHKSWLRIYNAYNHHINFEGILLTGWQRYDHFAILCELLPVAVPSLAMCLKLLTNGRNSEHNLPEIGQLLQCEQPFTLLANPVSAENTATYPKCSYPGGELLDLVVALKQLQSNYRRLIGDSKVQGWMGEYNFVHGFSNPQLVRDVEPMVDRLKGQVMQISQSLQVVMEDIYDNYTIEEWRETYVEPVKKSIDKLWKKKELLLARDEWPRRPLK